MENEASDTEMADENGLEAKKGRSSVEFPYTDLEAALEIAQAIHNHSGLGDCSTDQIAAQMSPPTTESSGTFRVKLSSAKVFGFVTGGRGTFKLTDLGSRAIDPTTAPAARAEAFLGVELYRKVFELFRGKMLPPTLALEKQLEDFGVSPKQRDRARQVLERSAKQSGFSSTPGRLIAPSALGSNTGTTPKPVDEKPKDESPPKIADNLHPFIKGLLDKLPPADTEWALEDRVEWLEATVSIFNLMYKGKGKIRIGADGERPR